MQGRDTVAEQDVRALDGKVAIIAISVDRVEDSKVADFAKENNMAFDIAHDTDIIVRAYKIDPIPTTYIIDKLVESFEADTPKKVKK